MYRPPLKSVICSVSEKPDVNIHKSPPESGRKQEGRQREGQRCGMSQPNKANQHECQPVSYKPGIFGAADMFHLHKMRAAAGGQSVL